MPFYVFYEYRSINDQGDRSYDIQWLTEVLEHFHITKHSTYETFYNFVNTPTRYDYRDYNSKIDGINLRLYIKIIWDNVYIFVNIYFKWKINMYITHDDDLTTYIVAYYSY